MSRKQKLELTWIGKDKQPSLEPRILIEDASKSYGAQHARPPSAVDRELISGRDGVSPSEFNNMLIHGDNLLALKALEQDFAGRIKCIFIDPPYNTGSAFEHYDDGVEHSIWLSLMRDRLLLLRNLLSKDGSMWITIDDNECHYLKVLCDEVFGRKNFVANVVWQKKYSPQNDAKWLSDSHDHILIYAKIKDVWRPRPLPRTAEMDARYKNPDNDPRGAWKPADLSAKTYSENTDYEITTPSGRRVRPPESRSWIVNPARFQELVTDKRIWFGKTGNNVPSLKIFLSEVQQGTVAKTIWLREEVGDNQDAKKEVKQFNAMDSFATPKPENLLNRVLEMATCPGDLVVDSFAGSGTTGAVAHKMGRRWIMVELGDHCETHCLPRLKKVCDGTDQGGISEAVGWKGGGGFKYYELAPSLLKKDKYGNWIISEEYNANMLAAAMAKHEGFKYSPDPEVYWKQGKSSEKDYIFTTTSFVQAAFIDRLHEEMAADEHLLICCKKFSTACKGRFPNIEIKKIPAMLLGRCEFGRDDYSLNIVNMPHDPDEPDFVPVGPPKAKKKTEDNPAQRDLFDSAEEKE